MSVIQGGRKRKSGHFQLMTNHKQLHLLGSTITLDVPVTNCKNLAVSSLLNVLTTSQNH